MCAFSGKDNGEVSKNTQRESGEFSDITTRFMRACAKLADRGVFISRRQNFDLSKISSIGIGGTVAAAFFPDTLAGLTELIGQLKKADLPFALLGTASNVLIPDKSEELQGAAVFTKRLRSVAVDGESVFAFCGVTGAEFLQKTLAAGLTGAEFLEGIPCSIGGATYMNAGANGRHVSDIAE
ncbi:MAG: FAD-binding protein, partial [Candidatus Scatosoma sp.]